MITFNLSFKLNFNTKKNKVTTPTFSDFLEKTVIEIPTLLPQRRPATIKNYRTAIKSLRTFAQATSFMKQHITSENLKKYEQWLHQQGISRNTSSAYIRSLRSLYNYIYPQENIEMFRSLFTGNTRTAKRALDISSVHRLITNRPKLYSPLRLWHDVFLFSIYALGMPFVDVAHLRWTDIQGNFICYQRSKTGQKISVPITHEMRNIMEHYRHQAADNLVFPILMSYDSPYQAYQQCLSRYNSALKHLMRRAQLSQNLTSYVARHTWASLANAAGIPVSHISQAMGHANLRTTQIYLADLSGDDIMKDSLAVVHLISADY